MCPLKYTRKLFLFLSICYFVTANVKCELCDVDFSAGDWNF